MRSNLGSGDSRMLVSVGLRAVVGMTPLFSDCMFRFALKLASASSGGFYRRVSSLSSCRIRDPRVPIQPFGEGLEVPTATPTEDLPYCSIEVTPTIDIQSSSLSSRPRSEAKEYIIEDMGSEYEAPRE